MSSRPEISVVVPLFNEAKRLPARLPHYVEYLENNFDNYELVLVNDYSTDGTRELIDDLAKINKHIKPIHNERNRGRGFSMKAGVMASSGSFILETDADLPVEPHYISDFINFLKENTSVSFIIGSRGLPNSKFVVSQPPIRVLAGHVFHLLFNTLFGIAAKDVMCGFKLFPNETGKRIFRYVYDEKYLAAAEIVYVAKKLHLRYAELPLEWEDNRQSKVRVLKDTIVTLKGMAEMMVRNVRGMYKER
jgi:dolichyl-phosphate beta-glucosyltransferase